jgi:hypothetical protein
MYRLLVLLIVFVSVTFSDAAIYKYTDDEGVTHFAVAPTDKRFRLFMPDHKKVPPPIPVAYVFKKVLPAGSIWAAKTTNKKGFYYWYMGDKGKTLVQVAKNNVIKAEGRIYVLRHGEIAILNSGGYPLGAAWLDGSPGYECFMATVKDASKRK